MGNDCFPPIADIGEHILARWRALGKSPIVNLIKN